MKGRDKGGGEVKKPRVNLSRGEGERTCKSERGVRGDCTGVADGKGVYKKRRGGKGEFHGW